MQAEHAGWFQPGSMSLSFLVFGICTVIVVAVVAFLVRHLSHRYANEGGSHH